MIFKPSYGRCPITMSKNRRKYNVTVSHGQPRMLQGSCSDVSVTIPPGTQGVYMTRVHTDDVMFSSVIPKDECLVGPLVEVEHLGTIKETSKMVYTLQIPHCVQNQKLWKFIRVRRGNPNKGIEFTELQTEKAALEVLAITM